MEQRERITLNMTALDVLEAMSEGNPGALTVLMALLKDAEAIDPDAVMGGMMQVLTLDSFRIYGSDIWVFFKDICREDLRTMIMVMRAVQLGFVTPKALTDKIRSCQDGTGPTEAFSATALEQLDERVCTRLPAFQKKGT